MGRLIAATTAEAKRKAARLAMAWCIAGRSPSSAKMARKVHAHRILLGHELDAGV